MKVYGLTGLEIDEKEVRRVVDKFLDNLHEGRWVYDGQLWEEHATSHRIDVAVGDKTHPDYAIVEAARTLQRLLKDRKN